MKATLVLLGSLGLASAHGYLKWIDVDGTRYPGYDPRIDPQYKSKRIQWGFDPKDGVNPILDVRDAEMTCRKNPTPPALKGVARAGANITFQWTPYFPSHKGPIMTYMARFDDPTKLPTELSWFKIHENSYDPKTHTWGSQVLMRQNETWSVQIPSDIKAGTYVVRHEIISLHFAENIDVDAKPTEFSSTQVLPVCLNVEVLGGGSATPDGVRFPGAYKLSDPGIKFNIYNMENMYPSPGPPVYQGRYDAPQGSAQKVTETGEMTGPQAATYKSTKAGLDSFFAFAEYASNLMVPGGGGCIREVGADPKTAVCTPRNSGGVINPNFKDMDQKMKESGKSGVEQALSSGLTMMGREGAYAQNPKPPARK